MKRSSEKIILVVLHISALTGVMILVGTLILIFISGYSVVDWSFLTSMWRHQDITQGGILPAILGSLYLGIGVIFLSFPLGIGAAIYLVEYGKGSRWRKVIQLSIRNLAGVPSVVYGLFGLALFVNLLSFGTSLLSATLTLSAMTLPWIITTSVEALEAIPMTLRESSLALGATHWQTIKNIVLPAAFPSAITGGIVSIARALGETAPIILVGATFYLTVLPSSPFDKFMALPYHTFILSTQHSDPQATAYAGATALVLIFIVFFLSIGAIIARLYWRHKNMM